MDFRHLRNMLAILEEGSLAKAAQRLNLTQPALTKSVQRLEEQLGVRLFERRLRGMQPTPYAESLRGYAKAACLSLIEAEKQLTALRKGTEGTLTLASPPLILANLLPQLLVGMARERPKLQIRAISQSTDLYRSLLDGKFDVVVAMFFNENPLKGLERRWLFDDRLVLVMRPDHPLARRRKIGAQELRDQSWISFTGDNLGRRQLKLYFEQEGMDQPAAQFESPDPAVTKAIVMASDHICMMSRVGVEQELAERKLRCVEIDSPLMVRPIGLALRQGQPMTPALEDLIQRIHEICAARRNGARRYQPDVGEHPIIFRRKDT